MRTATLLALALATAAMDRSYIDIRADLGSVDSGGGYAAIGIIGSSIYSERNSPEVPMGLLLGLRMERTRLKADFKGTDERVDLFGGSIQAGFAFLPSRMDTVETLFSWGSGGLSAGGGLTLEPNDGSYTSYAGRVGWYHTFPSKFQAGAWGGFSKYEVDISGTGGGQGEGLDLGVSGGYRF